MLSLSNNLVSIAIWINLLQTIWIVIYLSRDSEFVQWRWDRHSDAPRLGGRHVSQLVFLSVRLFFFESLSIDQNFTGWNTIKRSFHKKFALYDFYFYVIYIFWQFERNHQYEKVWIGFQEQNNVFSWQSGAETTFTSWEQGKSPCYFFKTYLQVFHTNMSACNLFLHRTNNRIDLHSGV